ncbi:MAG: CBS domain-containing protein [Bacteroidetes bacterium]|nr:CBS domain-containing protein [Bacteroidota bacterium]
MYLQTKLSEIMSTDLITVKPHDAVQEINKGFEEKNIHHIPVKNENGQLAGIVSKSDFLKISYGFSLFRNLKIEEYNRSLYETLLVKDIMTKDVAHLLPNDTVEMAIGIFKENLFHAIPIVDEGKLIGIVTTYDLLNMLLHSES